MIRLQFTGSMCLLLVAQLIGCSVPRGNTAEAEAIAAIKAIGGKLEFDEAVPDRHVLKVYLHDTSVKDSDLVWLEKLTRLQNLYLGRTATSDAGLAHLRGLIQLRTLGLNATMVTDAGLKQLAGLTNLKTLNLQETKVTAAGAGELGKSLPGLKIAR